MNYKIASFKKLLAQELRRRLLYLWPAGRGIGSTQKGIHKPIYVHASFTLIERQKNN